jgi:hypothetical protein
MVEGLVALAVAGLLLAVWLRERRGGDAVREGVEERENPHT